MAFTKKKVRELTAGVTVEHNGDSGKASYVRGALTQEWWDSLVDGEKVVRLVADVLLWLEYEDDEGNNLSPKSDDPKERAELWYTFLIDQPRDFVRAIFDAIFEDVRPGKQQGGESDAS